MAGKKKRKVFTKRYEDFCQAYHAGLSGRQACIAANLSPRYAPTLLLRPDINARLQQIAKDYGAQRTERAVEQGAFMVEHADNQVMDMAERGERKPGRLRACTLTYIRHKLMDPPGARIIQSTQANAGAIAGLSGGATAFQIYEGKWMQEQKAQWNKELEAKHAGQLPPANS